MLIRFAGLPHMQVYRGDRVAGGRAIKAGEQVDLPDDEAGYLLAEFPAGVFVAVSGSPDAAKAAHKAAVASKKAAPKAPPKSADVE